jgi:hypothetical protein
VGIEKIIERYNKDLVATETSYTDLILHSGGAVSYQDVMTMPVPAIQLLIESINKRNEAKNAAIQKSRSS